MNKIILNVAFMALLFAIPFSASAAADTTPPSVVENLRVISKTDTTVTLAWDGATDNKTLKGYVIYIGTKSVEEPGDEYNYKVLKTGNVKRAIVMDLQPGKKYYFAITARDKSDNESENYSNEVSVVAMHGSSNIVSFDDEIGEVEVAKVVGITPAELNLEGTIKSVQLESGTAFYLNTDDGKSYHLLSRALWRKAVLYTRGIYNGGRVRVSGTPAYNTAGKIFGIHYISMAPLRTAGVPANIPLGDNLVAKGIIKMRVAYPDGRMGYYLFSEDDGRKFMLLNTPDWKKARDFMNRKTRVAAYGAPVFNKTGHLYGIRYTDLVPLK